MKFGRWLAGFLVLFGLSALTLSWVLGVPYYYTWLGFLTWIVVGHLVTIDDEVPGRWSNPQGSESIWRASWLELAIKVAVLLSAASLLLFFPVLNQFGAR